MFNRDRVIRLYVLNSALFFTHEVDSGIWREWELFRLPGGAPGFLAANLILFVLVLAGLRSVVLNRPSRRAWAALLAAAGVLAALIHGSFLALGTPQFRTPASLGLLGLWLVASLTQLVVISRDASSTRTGTGPSPTPARETRVAAGERQR